jgi:glycine betaine/proline transport system ATP-binding protein
MSDDGARPVKMACQGLWKVFGEAPERFLARHDHRPPPEAFRAEGYIGACQDISFDVHEGEILMIMGLSGSGKSTLVRCLSRLMTATAGHVLLDDADLLSASTRQLTWIRRHKIGMVFQHFGLLGHRTVLENVAFPLEIQGIPQAKRLARAAEMLRTVGLEGRENYFPGELSGGQQQRVGLARSLAVDPELWFLDEPFSALDPLIRKDMQDEFLRLQRQLHKTIVFITHDFDEAVRLGDRIAILRDGRIEQIDTPENIVLHPANEYVARFAKDAPVGSLVRVHSVMESGAVATDGHGDAPVLAEQTLTEVAPQVLRAGATVPVHDDRGQPVGALHRDALIKRLFETDAP